MRTDFPSIIIDVLLLKNLLAWKIYAVLNTVSFWENFVFFSPLSLSMSLFRFVFVEINFVVQRQLLWLLFGLEIVTYWFTEHFYSRNSLYFQLSFYT